MEYIDRVLYIMTGMAIPYIFHPKVYKKHVPYGFKSDGILSSK